MEQFKLTEEHKQSPFSTPEGYFNDLPQRVQKRTHERKQPALAINWGMLWAKPVLRYTLPFVMLMTAGVFMYKHILPDTANDNIVMPTRTSQEILQEISQEEIKQYLIENEEVTSNEITDVVVEHKLSITTALPQTPELVVPQDVLEEELDVEDLEEYL